MVASGKRSNRYMYVKHVYHRFTTTVHTDVTVGNTDEACTLMLIKREQIIVDTGYNV